MIRSAKPEDLTAIEGFDHVMALQPSRVEFVRRAIEDGRALVAESNGGVIAYGVIHHQFFGRSFIDLVYIREDERNRGWGPRMLTELARLARGGQLFTSANRSNLHMQHVLERAGYRQVGIIDELDRDDPELIYVKRLDIDRGDTRGAAG